MSDGGIIQLATVGAQDCNFLSDNLNDTIFKESEKKINNCCKATFSMYPNGKATWGTTTRFKIQKKGDMLGSLYFVAKLPQRGHNGSIFDKWVDYIGNVLIENVKLYIGDKLIDEQTGEFMQIHSDLKDDDWNKDCLIGHNRLDKYMGDDDWFREPRKDYVYVPLKFWFCDNYNKYLPLIALQYHEVEIEIKIREAKDCLQLIKTGDPDSTQEEKELNKYSNYILPPDSNYSGTGNQIQLEDVRLDCNYVLLDTEDRRRIAQMEHEILITQTQKIVQNVSNSKSVYLNFNHPVKEMFWYIQNSHIKNQPDPFNFSTGYKDLMDKDIYDYFDTQNKKHKEYYRFHNNKGHWLDEARITIDGHPIIDWKDWKYFHLLQNYENYRNKLEHNIYLYSFTGNPKSKTPMGSLNFSRLEEAQLQIKINEENRTKFKSIRESNKQYKGDDESLTINVYAINYNYLVIKGGVASLLFEC